MPKPPAIMFYYYYYYYYYYYFIALVLMLQSRFLKLHTPKTITQKSLNSEKKEILSLLGFQWTSFKWENCGYYIWACAVLMKNLQEKCLVIIYKDKVWIFLLANRKFYHMNKLFSWVFMWIIKKYPLACMAVLCKFFLLNNS